MLIIGSQWYLKPQAPTWLRQRRFTAIRAGCSERKPGEGIANEISLGYQRLIMSVMFGWHYFDRSCDPCTGKI